MNSKLLYAAYSWILNRETEIKINAFDMWVHRRIGSILQKENKTKTAVLEKLEVKKGLLKDMDIEQLNYLGCIKKAHDSLLKIVLEGKVEGKRPRGRQQYIRGRITSNDELETGCQSDPTA
jgi:hypothetical protein